MPRLLPGGCLGLLAFLCGFRGGRLGLHGLCAPLLTATFSAIPKAAHPEHTAENGAALDVRLTAEDVTDLDHAFPPPDGPSPLEVL